MIIDNIALARVKDYEIHGYGKTPHTFIVEMVPRGCYIGAQIKTNHLCFYSTFTCHLTFCRKKQKTGIWFHLFLKHILHSHVQYCIQ